MTHIEQFLRVLVSRAAKRDFIYSASLFLIHLGEYLRRERHRPKGAATVDVNNVIQSVLGDFVVRRGPFRGLRYPGFHPHCHSLAPKLLGCYERELADTIETLLSKNRYSSFVNVGCGEGYYAVGIALRNPHAIVYAFDNDPTTLALCREMAQLNGVERRVILDSWCSAATLLSLPLGRRALIVSDCEGYEKSLFNKKIASALGSHDFLIETHDRTYGNISSALLDVFCETHDLTLIRSIDDWRKPSLYWSNELAGLDIDSRMQLLAEGRGSPVEWLIARSRDGMKTAAS